MHLCVLAILGSCFAHKEVISLLGMGGKKYVMSIENFARVCSGCVTAQQNLCYPLSRAAGTLRLPEGSFDSITCHI